MAMFNGQEVLFSPSVTVVNGLDNVESILDQITTEYVGSEIETETTWNTKNVYINTTYGKFGLSNHSNRNVKVYPVVSGKKYRIVAYGNNTESYPLAVLSTSLLPDASTIVDYNDYVYGDDTAQKYEKDYTPTVSGYLYVNEYNGQSGYGLFDILYKPQLKSDTVWYALGDSITQGSYSYFDENDVAHTEHATGGYPLRVSAIKGYKSYTNLGVAGGGWVKNSQGVAGVGWKNTINNNDFEGATLITVSMYINDNGQGVDMGTAESTDVNTIAGAMKWGLAEIARKAPSATIIVLGTTIRPYTWYRNLNTLGKEICALYNIPFIDLQLEAPISSLSYATMYPDTIHPSLTAYDRISKFLSAKLPD